jgi:hypothetical protein
MDSDVATLRFATWYDKGTIVEIPSKAEKPYDTMTPEERLLQCIFGSHKDYEVPVSGFYLLTADYGVDEKVDNGAFEDCEQMLVALSDDIYFAEEPLVPEGCLTNEQDKKRKEAKSKQLKREMEEKEIDNINLAMQNFSYIKDLIHTVIEDKISSDIKKTDNYCYGVFTVSTLGIAKTIVLANDIVTAVNLVINSQGRTGLEESLYEAMRSNQLKELITQILESDELRDVSKEVKRYIAMYLESIAITDVYGHNFYLYRDRLAKKFDNAGQVMIGAYASHQIIRRIDRCHDLWAINAPDVIRENELRLLAKAMIALQNIKRMESVVEGFEKEFGVYADGSKYDGPSDIGNYENMLEPEPDENETENETDIYLDEESEWNVVESKEPELEDKYIITASPNYAYRKGTYALFNMKRGNYYRENGEVMTFSKWLDVKDKRDSVNKSLK